MIVFYNTWAAPIVCCTEIKHRLALGMLWNIHCPYLPPLTSHLWTSVDLSHCDSRGNTVMNLMFFPFLSLKGHTVSYYPSPFLLCVCVCVCKDGLKPLCVFGLANTPSQSKKHINFTLLLGTGRSLQNVGPTLVGSNINWVCFLSFFLPPFSL